MGNLITPETPFYIAGLLAVVYYLQRQVNRLEKEVRLLQKQVTALYGIATAAKSCPIDGCKVKDLRPQEVFLPTGQPADP